MEYFSIILFDGGANGGVFIHPLKEELTEWANEYNRELQELLDADAEGYYEDDLINFDEQYVDGVIELLQFSEESWTAVIARFGEGISQHVEL